MRTLVLFAIASLFLNAQKKPVTLDAMLEARPAVAPSIRWSPDGKRFLSVRGDRLTLYDVASRTEHLILTTSSLRDAATKFPDPPAFAWENRRVAETQFQWTPDGRNIVAIAGGDVFLLKPDAGGYVQLTATAFPERDPKLSPDGKLLAYRHNQDLFVLDLASRKITRLTHDGSPTLLNAELDWVYPEELDLGTAYWWSPDSRSLAYLQFDISREMIHTHIDLTGLFARPEPQRYPKAGTPNADVRLGVVKASGGATRWMELGDLREHLIARVQWSPESDALAVLRLNRIQNQLKVIAVQTATGTPRLLFEENDPYWINIKDDFRLLPSRRQLLWSSERDGFRHLYLLDPKGKVAAQLTSGEFEVTAVNAVDEPGGRVFFTSTEHSPLERHLYSVSLNGGARRKLTNEKGTHRISMSPSGEYWIDSFSSTSEPPRTILRDAAGNAIATLREPDRKVQQQYQLLPIEQLTFKGADGTLFYAQLIKPAGFQSGRKYPAIVHLYGGPHSQFVTDSWAGLSFEQVLAHRGYVVWKMDNRGSAGRGHLWESKLHLRFGKQELEDQKEGVKHLIAMGFVDPARIGITGWSYGGYMTLQAMLHAPDLFHAGISGAPVTDWRLYDTIYTERYLGLPSENEKGYRESSPVHFANNLKGRLLLIHNFGDDNVLYQHSIQMQIAFQKAGKQYETLVYPQKTHGVSGEFNRHMRHAMLDFFDRHLKP